MPASNAAYVTTRAAKKALGDHTLRQWADSGLIPSIRTPAGQRLYGVAQFIEQRSNDDSASRAEEQAKQKDKDRICYCRVSSQGQKEDLQPQVAYMQERFPDHGIVTDVGSGINFKRRGLRSILELASKGGVAQVVVAYRDRLCRFAFELVQWILHLHGVELLVLHESVDSSGQAELAEDLLSIVHVFKCRAKYKSKGQGKAEGGSSSQASEESQQADQEGSSQHVKEGAAEPTA